MEPLSLFELNKLIRLTLDLNLEPGYWVVAEIGELRLNQKGHCYMELVEKEDDTVKAKIRANIWSYTYRNLSGWFEAVTRQSLQPGIKILANVTVNFHELYGLSLTVKDIDPNFTLGERARKKQEVIAQLQSDGVFNMNKELRLPIAPQRIAVISSPTAAGLGDFMDQLENNEENFLFEIRLFQAMMQGEKAMNSIIEAMYLVHDQIENFDVLVIIRGGGAQVDLDCFDTYDLASHVAQFPLPVITGIGHERDETITDLVAHTKMKTPTAVAAFLISGLKQFEEKLDLLYTRAWHHTHNFINQQQSSLDHLQNHLRHLARQYLADKQGVLDRFGNSLKLLSRSVITRHKIRLDHITTQIKSKPFVTLQNQLNKILLLEKSIQLLDPKEILKRGYTITTINGKLPDKIENIEKGMTMVTLSDSKKIISTTQDVKQTDG